MKDQREIIIPDLDYQAEVRKCKTMEDVVGKNGLMQKLFKDIIQQLLEAEMQEHLGRERHERSNETNPNNPFGLGVPIPDDKEIVKRETAEKFINDLKQILQDRANKILDSFRKKF